MKLCIYHGGCTDGVAAAWVIWEADPTWTFYPGVYQQEPPRGLVDAAQEILLVDFSYKLDMIESLSDLCPVTILDHHKTAQNDLESALEHGLIRGKFDMTQCGAMLAWEHFHGLRAKPDLLYEIDKQDRWLEDRDPALIMALRSYPHKPRDESPEAWLELMTTWSWLMEHKTLDLLHKDGRAIYRYYRQRIDETKGHERFVTLGDIENQREISVPIINAPFFMASDAAGELAEQYGGVGAVWWQNRDERVTFSLRSRGDYDVSELAKWYGGGGHKNAAGFNVSASLAKKVLFSGGGE